MDRTERFYKITQLLQGHDAVPREVLLEELGVSLATFKRDLEYLRDRLHAPIVWDRDRKGYRLRSNGDAAPRFELPGVWFSADEAHALLVMQQLLESFEPGVLAPHAATLKARIEDLLERGEHPTEDPTVQLAKRVRIRSLGARPVGSKHLGEVSSAVLGRKRLRIVHYARARDAKTTREISPQRLVRYRDNWYLDAWCHWREALRTFALDTIREAQLLDQPAIDVDEAELDAELGAGYGIFAGKNTQTARLRFAPHSARWTGCEHWHDAQTASFDAQGYYILELPYADDRELLMDILKYGPDVEVLAPETLRRRVAEALRDAAAKYARDEREQRLRMS